MYWLRCIGLGAAQSQDCPSLGLGQRSTCAKERAITDKGAELPYDSWEELHYTPWGVGPCPQLPTGPPCVLLLVLLRLTQSDPPSPVALLCSLPSGLTG